MIQLFSGVALYLLQLYYYVSIFKLNPDRLILTYLTNLFYSIYKCSQATAGRAWISSAVCELLQSDLKENVSGRTLVRANWTLSAVNAPTYELLG